MSEQQSLFGPVEPAAQKDPLGLKGVVVRETACKMLLNRCGLDDYSFNVYTGCTNACAYCYARFMQRFHPHAEAWGQFVDVKVNAVEVLARQLRRLPAGSVFTCSACDGWQGIEQHCQLTRHCCQMLLEAGFELRVLTKSELVLRDLDIFTAGRHSRQVRLGVTITTADEAMAATWEPGASSVAGRVCVLRKAKAAGLETTVMFGPILPGISDSPAELARLMALVAETRVDHIWYDALNARPRVWPSVQSLVRKRFPSLYELYGRVLFDAAYREAYAQRLKADIRQAAAEAGVADRLG